ncbi:MAG: zinc dependent phospholipase C family protein [Acidobacteriota bacterium]|nr:zinc dependent phospholipase C family protein [Acidobacteriota bacterium]
MIRGAALLLCASFTAHAYSVLSHEAIVDAVWEDSIKPILVSRFPGATPEALHEAHAYVYGGAIIQDMGYYPFGPHEFSDLTHYFRSGDFILNMLASARDLNEYAFALGSLAHYAADNAGHPIAVNPSVPLVYPRARKKFGNAATYEDDKGDHVRMEFAFDVAEVAERHYAPAAYHDFIGFEVSKPVLERAFEQTYDIALTDISSDPDLALGTYRWTVSTLIPRMTRAAWRSHRDEIRQNNPLAVKRRFIYAIKRSSFEREWGHRYTRPGFGTRFLAFLLTFIPKIGPFSVLAFHPATPETQRLFEDSFVRTLALYRANLNRIRRGEKLTLANTNFDTGEPSHAGRYRLADEAVEELRERLKTAPDAALARALGEFGGVTAGQRAGARKNKPIWAASH